MDAIANKMAEHLEGLCGKKVVAIRSYVPPHMTDHVLGLEFDDGTTAWILSDDPFYNSEYTAGFLDIEPNKRI